MLNRKIIASVTLLLIFIGCQEDRQSSDDTVATTPGEEQYFEDYTPPLHKWGFINEKGNFVIKPIYDDVRDFVDGRAVVSYKGRWGVIDSMGKILIPFKYLNLSTPSEGFAIVEDFDKHKFYIDTMGKKVFDCPYEECYSFVNGFARYVDKGMSGFLDRKGKLFKGRYTDAKDFVGKYAVVQVGNGYGIIDDKGHEILPMKYDKIIISEGLALVKLDNRYQYFNLKKNKFRPKIYEKAYMYKDGYAIVKLNGDYGIIDTKDNFTPFSKDRIRYLGENRWAIRKSDGYMIADSSGSILSERLFTNLFEYHCGILGVEQNGYWGYVDRDVNEVIPTELPIIWDCSEGFIRFITRAGYGFLDINSNVRIAPKFIEVRDFKEGFARAQYYEP